MPEAESVEPTLDDISRALSEHVDRMGVVPAGVARRVAIDNDWTGRLAEVLSVLDESDDKLAYLAGGRRPDEVTTWLSIWAESPLTVEQIRLVTSAGGWDPDPFVVLADAGLLEAFLCDPGGEVRRVHGQRAGAWLSDELALADEDQVLDAARTLLSEPPDGSLSPAATAP